MAAENVALAQAEVARRYKAKRKQPADLRALRVRDLNRLFQARYGHKAPDTPQVREHVAIIAHHLAQLPYNTEKAVMGWLEGNAPFYTITETKELLAAVSFSPKHWKARRLGFLLKLPFNDRAKMRITTIAAYDMSEARREIRRKQMAKDRMQRIRREKGAVPRAQYLATTLTASKPWIAEGITRRTWERRRAKLAQSLPV